MDNNSSGGAGISWDVMSQVQQMQQEILELRGMVEELKHQIDIMQKQERERYLDLDLRINQLQSGSSSGSGSGSGKAASAPRAKEDDKVLYDKASQLRKEGKYDEAISVLDQLLQQSTHPFEGHQLAPCSCSKVPTELCIRLLKDLPSRI